MTGRCRILVNAVVRASAPLPVSCWGAGRHPKGRNVVEQPRTARLDAAVGGAAPHGDVIHHVPALTFHSRSFPRRPPAWWGFAWSVLFPVPNLLPLHDILRVGMSHFRGIEAAQERSDRLDTRVAQLSDQL